MNAAEIVTLIGEGGRPIAVSVYRPALPSGPSVVFSHGANASPSRYEALFSAWTAQGLAVWAPLHCDSEEHPERVTDDPLAVRRTRLEDFALVVEKFCGPGYVAAGHSYGALIAQVAAGARLGPEAGVVPPAIALPSCVVALSPPPPMPGLITREGWSRCGRPMLCVTGTHDTMPGFIDDRRLHLAAAEAAPESEVAVFEGMDHYFNGALGRLGPGDAQRDAVVAALNARIAAFVRTVACS